MKINQYSVWWVNLNPIKGTEQSGHRPCVVISPNEQNHHHTRVIVVPTTSRYKTYPTTVQIESTLKITGKVSYALVDQMRAVSTERFTKELGNLTTDEITNIRQIIKELLLS